MITWHACIKFKYKQKYDLKRLKTVGINDMLMGKDWKKLKC